MKESIEDVVGAAEMVIPCSDLDAMLDFLRERLGFRLETISPADDPSSAVVIGHGLRLRLEQGAPGPPPRLRVTLVRGETPPARILHGPDGLQVEVETRPALRLPPLESSFVVSRLEDACWREGRAAMRYRDLIPGRQGGRFIASHIHIPRGGPVPDYPHFHVVHFQMIFCCRGWVRVVYADQGDPFVMHRGDCVLQPPRIRHQVLECSDDLEVIEVGCPAVHDTRVEHGMRLPTGRVDPGRRYSGQRFARHVAAESLWRRHADGFEVGDTGIGAASGGLADVEVLRGGARAPALPSRRYEGPLHFAYVLAGGARLHCDGHRETRLSAGDAYVIPPRRSFDLTRCSGDLELLQVTVNCMDAPAPSPGCRPR